MPLADDSDDDCDDEAYMERYGDDSESSSSGGHTTVDGRERDCAADSDEESRQMQVARLRSLETIGGVSASNQAGGVESSQGEKKKTSGREKADDGSKRLKWGVDLPKATMSGGKLVILKQCKFFYYIFK